jgi:ParB-like chromosome segregation protein Spo0J
LGDSNNECEKLRQRIVELEGRMTDCEKQDIKLKLSIAETEANRGKWQVRQEEATRNFRLENDAHLQRLEESLNEKVSNNQKDVVRLGRSNIALAALIQQCRLRLLQLATEDDASLGYRAKLGAHCELMASNAAKEESNATVEKAYVLSSGFQKVVYLLLILSTYIKQDSDREIYRD